MEAGRKSGDLLAPIIYCPELHFSEFASAIADMKNSVAVSTKREEYLNGCMSQEHYSYHEPLVL